MLIGPLPKRKNNVDYKVKMITKNRYVKYFVTAILSILLCLVIAGMCLTDCMTSYAIVDFTANSVVKVDELYYGSATDGTRTVNVKSAGALYEKLTGIDGAKFSDVSNLVAGGGVYSSVDIRNVNDGKNLIVRFGGLDWTVTYLCNDRSGNPIMTLWLASSSQISQYTSDINGNPWSNSTVTTYPYTMYSTSYIRSAALNLGTDYAVDNDNLVAGPAQDPTHTFARFTMSGINDSLTDFLVAPAQIEYQENESMRDNGIDLGGPQNLINDAYGTVPIYDGFYDCQSAPHYSDWKDDLIWLPSYTEVGDGDGVAVTTAGIWKCDYSQRMNTAADTYTRSSYSLISSGIVLTGASSGRIANYSTSGAVRPAIHVSLTELNKAIAYELPVKQEVTYDGHIKSIQSILEDKELLPDTMSFVASSQVSGTNADVYTAKLTLSEPYKWMIKSGSTFSVAAGTTPQDYKWEIKPKQLTLTWSDISSSYVWRSDLLADLQGYKPVIGGGITSDNLDVKLTYDGGSDNGKLDAAGSHKITAEIVTKNTSSDAATLLAKNYIMPTANHLEHTYTVNKATQLAPILGIDYENEKLIPTNPTVNGQDRRPWLQYKDDSGNWQAVVDMKISDAIMVGGAVSFRYKVPASHTDYIEDSGEYSLIIPKRQTASDMSIDYEKESVSIGGGYSYYIGTSAPADNDSYNVAGTAVSLDLGSGGYIAEQGQAENKIYYYVSAIAGTAFRSDIEESVIPARRAAPELGIDYKTEKTTQALTSKMMYTITGFDAPVKGNGNLVDLNPDRTSKTLRVWYAADASAFKSKEAVITIPARPAAPVIEYDIDSEEYLNGNAPTDKMEYRVSTSTVWDKADENTKPKRGMYVFRYTAVEEDKDSGITGAFASIESAVVDYGNKTINVTVRWKDERGEEFLSAYDYSGEVIKPTALFYTLGDSGAQVPVPSGLIKYVITNSLGMTELNPKDADTYKVVVSITDAAYTVTDGEIEYTINKLKISVPTVARQAVYNGQEQDIRQCLSNYDPAYTDAAGYMARNVSIDGYVLNLVLKNSNYEWADGRQENYVNIDWNIAPLERAVMWGKRSFTYDGSIKCPEGEIAGCDGEKVTLIYKGDTDAYKIHRGYTVTASISRDDPNYLNYTLTAGSESVTFDIVLGVGMTLIFIEWTDSEGNAFTDGGSFKYSGEVQHPKAVVRKDSADGEILTDIEIEYVDADGNPITSEWTGSYSVRIKVDNTLYGIDGECLESVSYNIIVDDNGDGEYKIIRIEIGGNYKSSYTVGEQFNATGMVVYGVYPDGERTEINVNDYTYAPKEALTEGDNTITVSYGDLSASFTVRAGSISGPMGGDFDGSNFVSKKLYLITVGAVGGLILLSVILACVIIKLARKIQRLFAAAGISEDGRDDNASGKQDKSASSCSNKADYGDDD